MSNGKFMYVTGKAMFAQVQKPNQFDRYTIDIVVDKVNAEKLRAQGLKPSRTEDGDLRKYEGMEGEVFRIKKNATKADGTTAKPVIVKDAYNEDFTGLIGNGSTVEVCLTTYTGKLRSGKEYVSSNLIGVQVVDLVPYEAPDVFEAKKTKTVSEDDPFESVD